MPIPEHLWRFPTAEAIESLARLFGLRNTPEMQDWPWEVADSGRIDELLAAYEEGGLSDDERFTLMEILLASFEDLDGALDSDLRWLQTLEILGRNLELHAYTVLYWADLENENQEDAWRVTPFLRRLAEGHWRGSVGVLPEGTPA